MEKVYTNVTYRISRLVTRSYSTSFSAAVHLLEPSKRDAIYSIYGFVRFADEIVDTFHNHEKEYLLDKFESDYYDALKNGISLNPILHSFTNVVLAYNISDNLVKAFLSSMRSDLTKKDFTTNDEISEYIYGSAEVVGLMCLKVFLNGDSSRFEELKPPAMALGAAFQKVNFLRDLRTDTEELGRIYFPDLVGKEIDEEVKAKLVNEISGDFQKAFEGIKRLPGKSKIAVLLAYYYYRKLLRKIERTPAHVIMKKRIRVPDYIKFLLLGKAWFVYRFRLI